MILLILALASLLRLINLNQSLWLDEATQVILSSDSLNNIIFHRGADFHPPLSYLLMHFWMIPSTSEIWLRLPSVIFGVLTVWILYHFAKQLISKKAALLAAFFLSIAPYHVYYSQEIRMYALTTFLASVSMYLLFLWLKNNQFRFALCYILATAALLYSHYFGFFILISQILYLIFWERKKFKAFIKYFLAVIIAWLVWLPQFLTQLNSGLDAEGTLSGWGEVLNLSPLKIFPLTFLKFTIGRVDFEYTIPHLLLAGLILLFVVFLLLRSCRENLRLAYIWLVVPLILAFLISLIMPIYQPFRLLLVIPAFYILIAWALWNLGKYRKIFIPVMILISFFGLVTSFVDPRYQREDWRGATDFIRQETGDDSLILFAWPEAFPPYRFYGGEENTVGAVPFFPAKQEDVEKRLKMVDAKKEIFLFGYLQPLSDPKKIIQKILTENGFKQYNVYNFNGVGFVYHYKK